MAWNKSELTAEDLKKAGLDPADLAELKANGVKKVDLDALKTELSTSLNTSMTELITNQFKEMEGRLKPKETTTTSTVDTVDEPTEFLSDPTAYINKKVGQ